MSDWAKFFETAGLLYSLWPALFNWAAGLVVPFMAVLVTAAWWMRGYKAETREATLEGEKIALKGQLELLNQRLALVSEQQKMADAQAKKVEAELLKISSSKPDDAGIGKDIPVFDAGKLQLEPMLLRQFLDANNAVSSTLNTPENAIYRLIFGNEKK
jgi:hypothetical protein